MASIVAGKSSTVNRENLHREVMRILNANSFHFITISLLFLPLTFSASAAVQSYFSFSAADIDVATYFYPPTLRFIKTIIASYPTLISVKSIITVLAFTITVILPTVAGVALITYSANQAIHRKPLTFSSAVKSLSRSYFPLFSTIVAGSIKLILISLLFTLSAFATTEAVKSLRFVNLDQFIVSICINTIASYAILLTVLFFIVIWGSAAAIAVLESKLGFESLRQSANQSTEFRSNSYSLVFLLAILIGSVLMTNSVVVLVIGSATNWVSILQVCAICLHSSLMILHYVVANTVLYVQYKVASGEEIVKTAADVEVSGEYVTVAVKDEDEEVSYQLHKDESNTNGAFSYMVYFFIIFWSLIVNVNVIRTTW